MSKPWTTWLIVGITFLSINAYFLLHVQGQPGDEKKAESSPLAVEPGSLDEQFEAAVLMADLGRFDLAQKYLQQILAQNPSEEDLLKLRDRFGTVALFRLARTKQLHPASQTLLQKVTVASRANATNPQRIDRVLADLEKSPRERELAILELHNIGIAAMPRLIQHLGNPQSDQQRDRLVYIMTKMGPQILPALFGSLESSKPMLQTSALGVIGVLAKPEMVDPLWSHAFGEQSPDAVKVAARVAISRILFGTDQKTQYVTAMGTQDRLVKTAKQYLGNQKPWAVDDDGRVVLWKWDRAGSTVQPIPVSVAAASLDSAVKYSQQALGMPGEKTEVQALFLSSVLADAAYRAGGSESMPSGPNTAFNLAIGSGTAALKKSVEISLEAGQIRAAEAAIAALVLVGNKNLLKSNSTQTPLLIRGINHPNRRVQFACAAGILQLEPQQSFRSSGRVVEIMAQALSDDGSRKVLVIDPNGDRGRGIATAVSQMGFNQETSLSGKEGFKLAASRGDITLVMIHLNCVDWELAQTISNLRADARTADLPIVIYGPTHMQTELLLTIQRNPRSMYLIYSDKRVEVERQLLPFLDAQTSPPLTPEQRNRRAGAAAYWLAQIAETNKTDLFNLEPASDALFKAINTPALAADALTALSKIPTNRAQLFLAEAVLAQNQTQDVRHQAAMSLAYHIQNHGLLLNKEIVNSLKTVWKAEKDAGVQTALMTVIGSLKPSSMMTENRMQLFVPPALPAQN